MLCLCSHSRPLHRDDRKCVITACGCDEYRLDARSPVRDDPAEAAATEEGAA